MHTALHLLCSLIPFPVTGGSIGAEESRLDFDISDADAVDKDDLTERLNALVAADHAVSSRWISDQELADNPGLVRTMSVKPPVGSGRVRLVAIGPDGAVDLQPCGGTHVRSTGEIGALAVIKIEKKGRQNRRIRLAFADRA
jgi:misacylated tRNA(Ala) deacylase